MSSRTSSTLGFERRNNPMLAPMAVEEFVRLANDGLGAPPPNVERIVEINRGPLLRELPQPREVHELVGDEQVLDVRPATDFADHHLSGSLNVPLDGTGFGTRAARARRCARGRDRGDGRRAGRGRREQAARRRVHAGRAARPGAARRRAHERFEALSMDDLAAGLGDDVQVLDVPRPGRAPGASRSTARALSRGWRTADLGSLDSARPTAVFCQTGARTPLAASLLAARGFEHVRPVLGDGMRSYWKRGGVVAT